MMEAHIVSARGSLYYAGDTHPYDLEMLWEHVRDAGSDGDDHGVHIEILLDDDGIAPPLSEWIHKVTAVGVRVQLFFTRTREAIDLASIRYAS